MREASRLAVATPYEFLTEMEATYMFREYPDVVSAEQLQKMLGIGRNSAYKLLSERIIKAKKIGRIYFIPKNNVINFLNNK